jgi:hypothetical protein
MRPSFELKQKGGRFVRLLFVMIGIQIAADLSFNHNGDGRARVRDGNSACAIGFWIVK